MLLLRLTGYSSSAAADARRRSEREGDSVSLASTKTFLAPHAMNDYLKTNSVSIA